MGNHKAIILCLIQYLHKTWNLEQISNMITVRPKYASSKILKVPAIDMPHTRCPLNLQHITGNSVAEKNHV